MYILQAGEDARTAWQAARATAAQYCLLKRSFVLTKPLILGIGASKVLPSGLRATQAPRAPCMYIHIYIYIYIYVVVYQYVYNYIYIYMYTHNYVYMYIKLCMYI